MSPNPSTNISQCQSDLDKFGHCFLKMNLPNSLHDCITNEDYESIDTLFKELTATDGLVFESLSQFCPVEYIEFIISLRDADNEWEEDGIWHDDGSRILAFSLSLTQESPEGGVLEFREKNKNESHKIHTPEFGTMIIFKTGVDGFEHKINAVTQGKRLIIAGWCYPSKSNSSL